MVPNRNTFIIQGTDDDIVPLKSLLAAGITVALATDNTPISLWHPVQQPVLRRAITETAATRDVDATVLGTLRRSDDETWEYHASLGALLAAGLVQPRSTGRLVDLPTTPWERARHWPPPARP